MTSNEAAWNQLVDNLVAGGTLRSDNIIHAMREVPRALFLPSTAVEYASVDAPLPIGEGQTASAPHMVAIMNEALELSMGHRVLEVGSGCGWHAATVGEIVAPKSAPRSGRGHVYTVEIVPGLAQLARDNIMRNGFGDRVTVIHGDGSQGHPDHGPFDRIMVTAAAPAVPPPLLEQLKTEGVLVIPVGSVHMFQSLIRIRKDAAGSLQRENLGGVAFVPLTGDFGHKV